MGGDLRESCSCKIVRGMDPLLVFANTYEAPKPWAQSTTIRFAILPGKKLRAGLNYEEDSFRSCWCIVAIAFPASRLHKRIFQPPNSDRWRRNPNRSYS